MHLHWPLARLSLLGISTGQHALPPSPPSDSEGFSLASNSRFFPAARLPLQTLYAPGKPKYKAKKGESGSGSFAPVASRTRAGNRPKDVLTDNHGKAAHNDDNETWPLLKILSSQARPGHAPAAAVLLVPPPLCPSLSRYTKASPNTAAHPAPIREDLSKKEKERRRKEEDLKAHWNNRKFRPETLHERRPVSRQEDFKEHIERQKPLFDTHPSVWRILDNESDVGGAFMANNISPILDIVNECIKWEYKGLYEVAAFTEVHVNEGGSSFLDIALMLIDKQPYGRKTASVTISSTETIGKGLRKSFCKNAQTPALFFRNCSCPYAHKWDCRRFYLSDYTHTLALDIPPQQVKNLDKHINLAFAPCRKVSYSKATSVYDYGPKMAIAFDAVDALADLGLVDRDVISGAALEHAPGLLRAAPKRR
ncbi:hypothetical protein JCM8097_004862 [Rhodosporidiobolus ruineniae]